MSQVNHNIPEVAVKADLNCTSAVGSNLISDLDLDGRAVVQVPSKAQKEQQ